MNFLALTFCFLTIIFCSINFADTTPCQKPENTSPRRKTALGLWKSNAAQTINSKTVYKSTTLSPHIQMVLNQLEGSKFVKDKTLYKSLLRQMKDVFHARPSSTVCTRCRKS